MLFFQFCFSGGMLDMQSPNGYHQQNSPNPTVGGVPSPGQPTQHHVNVKHAKHSPPQPSAARTNLRVVIPNHRGELEVSDQVAFSKTFHCQN